jgi:Fe-S cluster biogenesis protein NfuA
MLSPFRRRAKQDIPQERGPLYAAVHDALDAVRGYARSHGGDIELMSVSEDGEVLIRMSGMCRGCPLSDITFKLGIEEQLKTLVPGVRRVTKV